jgi:hypothetical protein
MGRRSGGRRVAVGVGVSALALFLFNEKVCERPPHTKT